MKVVEVIPPQVVEIIPFKSFRERLRLMKKLQRCKVEVFNNYLHVERS